MELPRVDLTEAGEFTEAVAEMIFSVVLFLSLSDVTSRVVGVGGVEHGSSGKADNAVFGTGVDEAEVNDVAVTGGVPMVGEGIEISSSIL